MTIIIAILSGYIFGYLSTDYRIHKMIRGGLKELVDKNPNMTIKELWDELEDNSKENKNEMEN